MHSHTAYLAPLPSCCSLPSVHRQNVEMSTISHGKGILGAKGAGSGAGGIRTSDTCSVGLTLALSLCISAIISMALLVASSLVDIMASSRLLAVSTSANMSILVTSALALSSGTPLLTSSAMYALLIASRFSGVGSSLLLSLSCALTIILPEQLLLLCSLTTILILHYLLLLDLLSVSEYLHQLGPLAVNNLSCCPEVPLFFAVISQYPCPD